jgi:hypothetical protein
MANPGRFRSVRDEIEAAVTQCVSKWLIAALAVCLMVACNRETPAQGLPASESLAPLVRDRLTVARGLAESAAACVARRDTDHATFHGCIDWHSAVHGVWALVAYSAMTGDARYEPLIHAKLSTDLLGQELKALAGDEGFENPYGRAWLLRLALDYERHFASRQMRAIADHAAASMLAKYESSPPNPRSPNYENASWALINLMDYYGQTANAAGLHAARRLVLDHFVHAAGECDSRRDRQGFMAICLNWAWAVSKVLPKDQFLTWLQAFLPAQALPTPIRNPRTAHEHGLNFNRAWGLWALAQASSDSRYLDAYVAHFNAGYAPASNWRGDYAQVGHWVAQFGMLALQPLFKPEFR